MAMAANILWKEIVHKAFQASSFVSATPIAMPSKTEWKHKATINKMLPQLNPQEPGSGAPLKAFKQILIQS